MTEVPESAPRSRVAVVVDDEKVIATSLAIILNNSGFDAHAFFNGQEALTDKRRSIHWRIYNQTYSSLM
jgi:FixJ family two-component response regulator